jgi:hypothetical protein
MVDIYRCSDAGAGLSGRILRIAGQIAERMDPERFEDPNEWLYDENGLPT